MKWWCLLLAMLIAGGAQAKTWVVKPDGVGPFKVGARYDNLRKTWGGLGPATRGSDLNCLVARSLRYPEVEITFVNKLVARVDVSGTYGSDRGVQIGDPVDKLRRLYGESARSDPDHADWLTVETGGGELAIRYLLREGRVAEIHAGRAARLQTVHGCS